MIVFGVDPGVSGAISKFVSGILVEVVDMPTLQDGKKRKCNCAEIANILNCGTKETVVIEKVHSMPGQGVSSMFSFGMSFGMIQGVAMGLGHSVIFVTPQKWKKQFSLIGRDKDQARTIAQELYPEFQLSRKKDVGRADAILIGKSYINS